VGEEDPVPRDLEGSETVSKGGREHGGIVSGIELIRRAQEHGTRPAILSEGRTYSYRDLSSASAKVAGSLLEGSVDLEEARIAFLIPGSFDYVAVQWGIWRAGGIAVPLSAAATEPELEHVFTDAEVRVALVTDDLRPRLEELARRLGVRLGSVQEVMREPVVDPDGVATEGTGACPGQEAPSLAPHPGLAEGVSLPAISWDRRAMMLYTSGTTSKPKGVVSTHGNIEAQIRALVEAWGWRADDRIPLFLPLHHIHGIVNVLSCALWSGAFVETFHAFDMERIMARVAEKAYTVFMAVPTIYVKLIRAFEEAASTERERWAEGFRDMRLMISGSAALPAAIHERWTELTGQKLLERYGMTEIGMGLSNPLHGERRPGAVGHPLPGVELRLVSESGDVIQGDGQPGEIQVRGPGVFAEYWKRPEATRASFVDGWFRTGDMAVLEDGYYRILGRLSVDIIKSGGYKLSALEIEDVLREHPAIREVSVVGVEDDVWGEAVAAAVIPVGDAGLELETLREWAGERLSRYKIPRKLVVVEDFPRNAMGKVMKPAVKELFVDG
jgi:malonyl-CoA/methylmalonyl-CoA synthetase